MRCPNCQAAIADGAKWCPQCYARFDEPVEAIEEPAKEVAHPETYRPPPRTQWSRWRAGAMTFGPVGRVVASLALLIPFYFFFYAGVLGIVGMAMWIFIVMPAALRSIWKRTRINPPED
jgi:hypothetical protein